MRGTQISDEDTTKREIPLFCVILRVVKRYHAVPEKSKEKLIKYIEYHERKNQLFYSLHV